jgi:hypothetical protein
VLLLVISLCRREKRPNFGREPLILGSQETERTSSRLSAVEMFSSMWNSPEKQTTAQAWEIDAAKLHINQKTGTRRQARGLLVLSSRGVDMSTHETARYNQAIGSRHRRKNPRTAGERGP